MSQPTPPPLGTVRKVLGEYGSVAVHAVLYGDLSRDWRRVRESPKVPDGVRLFVAASQPPLPVVTLQAIRDGARYGYRRGWLFARDRAKVDEAGEPGMRRLLFEPLADLTAANLAYVTADHDSEWRMTVIFPHRYVNAQRRVGLKKQTYLRGEPLTGDAAISTTLTLAAEGNGFSLVQQLSPGADQTPALDRRADAATVSHYVSDFIATYWDRCLPSPQS